MCDLSVSGEEQFYFRLCYLLIGINKIELTLNFHSVNRKSCQIIPAVCDWLVSKGDCTILGNQFTNYREIADRRTAMKAIQ